MAFTTARASCKLSFGSLQDGLAPVANIISLIMKGYWASSLKGY